MKFKNVIQIMFLVATLLVVSCKKKKESVKENDDPLVNPIQTFSPTSLNGYLSKTLVYYFSLDTFRLNVAWLTASFYNKLIHRDSIFYSPYSKDVGDIFLNDTALNKSQENGGYYYGYYNEWNPTHLVLPFKWKITGKDDFLPINYTDNTTLPTFDGAKEIIDTLYLFQANTLKIKQYKNVDKIEVCLTSDFCNGIQKSETITLMPPLEEAVFKANDIRDLNRCVPPLVSVEIKMYKNNYQKINALILNFETICTFNVYMIPVKY